MCSILHATFCAVRHYYLYFKVTTIVFFVQCKSNSMLLSVELSHHENNSDLASVQHFSFVSYSIKLIKLFSILISILEITSKGVLDSVSKQLLGTLSNHLVDRSLDTVWEAILDSESKSMPKLFYSKIIL